MTLEPIVADLATSMRGASIEPYRPYIPIKAQLAGNFNGDNRSQHLAGRRQADRDVQGHQLDREAGAARSRPRRPTPLKMERMEMAGIDFALADLRARWRPSPCASPRRRSSATPTARSALRELLAPEPSAARAGARARRRQAGEGRQAGTEGGRAVPPSRGQGRRGRLPARHRRLRHRGRQHPFPRPHGDSRPSRRRSRGSPSAWRICRARPALGPSSRARPSWAATPRSTSTASWRRSASCTPTSTASCAASRWPA